MVRVPRGLTLFGGLPRGAAGALWRAAARGASTESSGGASSSSSAQGPGAGTQQQGQQQQQQQQQRPGSRLPLEGPGLSDFLRQTAAAGSGNGCATGPGAPSAAAAAAAAAGGAAAPPPGDAAPRRVHIESYGCQMNFNDSEVVLSVLAGAGYAQTPDPAAADVVLLNTCAIRENAEAKVWQRLGYYKNLKHAARRARARPPVVGVLGCMAERLKSKLLESGKLVDLVVGPDAYRDLPRLIRIVQGEGGEEGGEAGPAINVQLSAEETYADIVPLRQPSSTSAFLSIMRGCNNMCAFCIVPYTRGRERSRPLASILEEVKMLSEQGVREVTLLGQNVNSYADLSQAEQRLAAGSAAAAAAAVPGAAAGQPDPFSVYARGFHSVYRPRRDGAVSFAELLDRVAEVDPEMRIRFTSPHPKDFSDEVLQVIASRPNVCKQLHMPAQSGSSAVLERMRRGYTREAYDALVAHVREVIPAVSLSTDIITGFCGETEEEHLATLDLMRRTAYDQAFMFAYSDREKTYAARHLQDDVPEEVKARRLQEVIAAFRETLHATCQEEVGRRHLVLVEGASRRSESDLTGRTDTFKRVVFPDAPVPASYAAAPVAAHQRQQGPLVRLQPGDYVVVEVTAATGGTLLARPLARTSIAEFVGMHGSPAPLELQPAGGEGAAAAAAAAL